jgi:hypothetical protein
MLPDKSRHRFRPVFRVCFFVMGGLLLAGLLFLIVVPRLDGPHSRQHAHEAVAVGKLRTVIELQSKYAAAHAETGFACELAPLKPTEQRDDADYDPTGFLTTGTWAGYRFALDGCQVDKRGVVAHYQASAVPIERGTTGFRAFCTDETGIVRYDNSGLKANCLASGRALN